MVGCLTVFCLAVAFISYYKVRYFFNPITFMFLIWGIIVPISACGFYGMNVPSNKTFVIITVGLIGYLAGCLLGWKPVRIKRGRQQYILSGYRREAVMNYRFLYIICGIAILYFAYVSLNTLKLLLQGNTFSYVKQLAVSEGENELRSSIFVVTIKNFIAQPTVYLMIAILPIELLRGKKDKKLIIMTLVLAVLWIFTTAGRAVIIWLALYFACVYTIQKKKLGKREKKKFKRRTKFMIIFGGIVLFAALVYTTIQRKGRDVDMYRQFLIYFVAPIPHMDHYVQLVDSGYKTLYGYGISSFYGFAYPVLFMINLFMGGYPEYLSTVRNLSFDMFQETIALGGTIYMNAYVTMFFQPYVDGRFIGVFFMLAVFGYLCSNFFYKSYYFNDKKSLLLYLLFLQKIMDSMVRYYFTQPSQAMCMIFATLAMSYVIRRPNINRGIEKHV